MGWLWWVATELPGWVGIAGPMPGPFLGRGGGLGPKLAMEEGLGESRTFVGGEGGAESLATQTMKGSGVGR